MIESIKTVFFDIDNTLLDHVTAEQSAVMAIGKIYHQTIPPAVFLQTWNEKTQHNWARFEQGKLTFDQQRVSRIRDIWGAFGSAIPDEEVDTIVVQYLDLYERNWSLFPDVADCLQKLSDSQLTLGIISNGSLLQQMRKLQATGISKYFQENLIIVSDQVGINKPNLQIFTVAQQKAGCSPSEILYVGDDIEKDMEPAASLSWHVALIDRKNQYKGRHFPYRKLRDLRRL